MTRRNKGFTLVEILIVVIILGILAAVVIPQFTEASGSARTNALMSDLQTVRSQLELYKVQHNDVYPSYAGFVGQMTGYSDASGSTGTVRATYPFGPYLQKMPSNPYVSGATSDDLDSTKGGGTAGWFYDATTGEFCPDDNDHTNL